MKQVVSEFALALFGMVWLPVATHALAGVPSDLALIPAGTFEMGDHHGFVDPKHGGDETPVHKVRIGAFQIARTHVTNGQYAAAPGQRMQTIG